MTFEKIPHCPAMLTSSKFVAHPELTLAPTVATMEQAETVLAIIDEVLDMLSDSKEMFSDSISQ